MTCEKHEKPLVRLPDTEEFCPDCDLDAAQKSAPRIVELKPGLLRNLLDAGNERKIEH